MFPLTSSCVPLIQQYYILLMLFIQLEVKLNDLNKQNIYSARQARVAHRERYAENNEKEKKNNRTLNSHGISRMQPAFGWTQIQDISSERGKLSTLDLRAIWIQLNVIHSIIIIVLLIFICGKLPSGSPPNKMINEKLFPSAAARKMLVNNFKIARENVRIYMEALFFFLLLTSTQLAILSNPGTDLWKPQ